jgi:hypothetical protein
MQAIKERIKEDKDKCKLWEKDLNLSSRKEISFEMINFLTVEYANKFWFSKNSVSKQENKNYYIKYFNKVISLKYILFNNFYFIYDIIIANAWN